jgi:putative ABC transport system permease protein
VLFFSNADKARAQSELSLMEGAAPRTADEIVLPYLFRVGGGYRLGDSFDFSFAGNAYHYTISGFSEEIIFGSLNFQAYRLYLSQTGFAALAKRVTPDTESILLSVWTTDAALSPRLDNDFVKEFFFEDSSSAITVFSINSTNIVDAKIARTWMPSLVSAIIIVFSALIVLISLIVIRFRIHNGIEEGMTNIGALKAAGYTSSQIIGSYVLQFGSVCTLAVLLGTAASYVLLPAVSFVLEQQTALAWEQGFDAVISGVTCLAVLAVVMLVTLIATRRVRHLQPLEALRGGLSTHSFRRNHLPLESTAGPLPLILALKSALRNKGQVVMIILVVTVMSFTTVAGLSIYYNLGIDLRAFTQLVGGEVTDAAFLCKDGESAATLHDELATDDEVRKLLYYEESLRVTVEGELALTIVVDDYALFENEALLYEGRYPLHDNEIALSALLAERFDTGIGQTVELLRGGARASYLICGLIQTFDNGGGACAITIEGYERIDSGYLPTQIYAYLEDPSTTADLIRRVEDTNGALLNSSVNFQELVTAQLGVYGSIFAAITIVILAVTMLVIIGVLYLVLRTTILRLRREIGIQKALGFTTLQIMNQLALCFLPAVTLGVVLGALLGVFGFNSVFVAMIRTMGIMNASLPAPLDLTLIACVGLVAIAYGASLLIALGIRRIDPYRLIAE